MPAPYRLSLQLTLRVLKDARGFQHMAKFINVTTTISPTHSNSAALTVANCLPIVTAAVYRGFDQELAPHHLTFRHRAGVTPYTSTSNVLAECCVFDKQSQPPILCGPSRLGNAKSPHLPKAHLLPKLRCQFAEFLLPSSLKRLRILISRTSVGLRYGRV